MKLKKNQVEQLRDLLQCDAHSSHHIRTEIKNIVPELFKSFEVGKYYFFEDKFSPLYFKVTDLNDEDVFGYGFEGNQWFNDRDAWASPREREYCKEITRTEFLEKVKEYAVNVLGFKSGVCCYWETLKFYSYVSGEVEISGKEEWITIGNHIIFNQGNFAEIVETTNLDVGNITADTTKSTIWEPTMELRWADDWEKVEVGDSTLSLRRLQQKWVCRGSGVEEWKFVQEE